VLLELVDRLSGADDALLVLNALWACSSENASKSVLAIAASGPAKRSFSAWAFETRRKRLARSLK
jgi:hypothetical protein